MRTLAHRRTVVPPLCTADVSAGRTLACPVTFSVRQFKIDNLAAVLDVDNFGTMSVTPGVEMEVSITNPWSLKPLACGGWRTELNGPRSA